MRPDGTGRVRLTHDPEAFDEDPAWSPDGTRIAFIKVGDAATPGIYVINTDGSDARRVLEDATGARSPSWSPDGATLVFESGQGQETTGSGSRDIYAVDISTGGTTRLTTDPARDEYPALSSDGSTIAFTRQRQGDPDIYVMRADGSGVRQLTSGPGIDLRPAWSPDGTEIAFERNGDIYVMGADGSGITALTEGPQEDWDPVWSPDGSLIAFVRDGDIYEIRPDGSGLTKVTVDGAGYSDLAWQPVPEEVPTPTPSPPTPSPLSHALTRADLIDVGADFPNAVIAGEGGVWVSAPRNDGSGAGDVVRLDPATGAVLARVPDVPLPGWETGGGGLAVGQGSVWVMGAVYGEGDRSNGCCSDRVVLTEIDAATNRVADLIDLGAGSYADVWVDETGIWALVFTPDHERLEVIRLDPATHEVVAHIPIDGIWSQQIWVSEGAVWVNASQPHPDYEATVGASTLTQIDPATNRVTWMLPNAAFIESGGPDDGEIWIETHTGLATLDGQSHETSEVALSADWNRVEPFAIDETGGVWVFGGNDRGQWIISRFDATSGSVDASVELGPDTKDNRWWIVATALDVETDRVWVVHYRDKVSVIEIGE
jgi:dipeptidyl aminopeptidase/acylaminoacyl peptidase